MYYIGPHVSTQGGAANAPAYAKKIGATGFGMFVKNQRQWIAPPLAQADADAFKTALAANGYTPAQVLPHAGYLINLANPDPDAQKRSLDSFVAELKRCHAFGLTALNLHPGSHLRLIPVSDALRRVGEAVNAALDETEGVRVVLENTAGQGGYLGQTLEELAAIIDVIKDRQRVGVCFDTCHAFAAGYELGTPENVAAFLDDVARLIGLDLFAGLHFNDTAGERGRHLDRHAPLGEGQLGWETFRAFVQDPRCENIPIVLETPDEDRWPDEVKRLLDMTKQ